MSLEDLRHKRASLNLKQQTNEIFDDMDICINGINHAADIAKNGAVIISHLDDEFEAKTKLHGKDIGFLFFATALQCVRQYFLTDFKERLGDQEAAKNTKGHTEEHSNRNHRFYNPSLEEIISNPVPFDTTYGAPDIKSDIAKHGGHRYTTLGHDPILGWIFGTANIATATLTDYKFQSYHIFTEINKVGHKLDKLTNHADTEKVLIYTFDKLLHQGNRGKEIVAASLIKEAIHLKSDIGTSDSLPIPIISTYSPDLAANLAEYGLDMANILTVGKQITYASAINMLIAMIHRMTFNKEKDGNQNLYEVRTRRVVTYSNVIATASNVLAVGISAGIGAATENKQLVRKSFQKLDIGGFLVTIYRLINDKKFIDELKQEFILNNFEKLVSGDI